MSVSKLSREIHVIDVPDVDILDAKFVYNYHVAEEGTNGEAGISAKLLSKPGEFFDSKFIDYLGSARAPRYVVLNWKQVSYRDRVYGQSPYFQDGIVPKNYIRDNITRVLSEEYFASEDYTSLNVTDQSIDKKLYNYISSSAVVLDGDSNQSDSQRTLVNKTNNLTSDQVDFQFLSKYLSQPSEEGAFFYKDSQRIRNDVVNKLKDFNLQVQINNGIFHSLIKRALIFPESTFNSTHLSLFELSRQAQGKAQVRGLRELRADDYRTVATEHVGLRKMESGEAGLANRTRVVGYIIDRLELKSGGRSTQLEPIVIENPAASSTLDLRVKYYGRYQYTIRTVAEFTIPSIVEDTGELAVAKFLIASKPSKPTIVDCRELIPPPPASDVKFTWNWETDKLFVSWAFPPNAQRDIKQFQVFRRSKISEPFQLVKQIVFDDSTTPAPYSENPDLRLVESVRNPKLFWIDDEFTKDSKYIYTVATVDAHGLVSQYGSQDEVRFDRFRNRLVIKRVSQPGAPRPYPNLYVAADAFRDSIMDRDKRTMTIAFTPEHLKLVDKDNNDLNLLRTDTNGGSYKILILNTDLDVAETVEMQIEDHRSAKQADASSFSAIPNYGNQVAKGTRD